MNTRLPADPAPTASMRSTQTETRLRPSARLLLRVDGVFEAVLGALLILGSVMGHTGALTLPDPATRPVMAVCGVLLLPVLPVLWMASRAPRQHLMRTLATVNGVGAAVLAMWVLIWNGAFHPAGAVFVIAVAVVLAILAALQGRSVLVKGG